MWIRKLLALLLLLITFGSASANVDSLRAIWSDESQPDSSRFAALHAFYPGHVWSIPDSVIALARYHFNLAEQLGAKAEMAVALNEQAISYYILGKTDSTFFVLHRAIDLRRELHDSTGVAALYTNIGNVYRDQRKFQEAVRYYNRSLDGLKKGDRVLSQADVINNLGLIYQDLHMYPSALDHLNQALELYKELGEDEKVGNIWLNLAGVHSQLGEQKKAFAYLYKALKILEASEHLYSAADCHSYMATLFNETGTQDSALYHIRIAIDLYRQIRSPLKQLSAEVKLAGMLVDTDLQTATTIGERVRDSLQSQQESDLMVDVYHLLYRCYKKKGLAEQALAMHEKYKAGDDSLLVEKNQIAVVREAIQHDFEQKLLLTQHENEKQQASLELKQLQRIYIIILIGFLLLVGIVLFARQRIGMQRKQQKRLLEEIERLKIAGTLSLPTSPTAFQLDRAKLEAAIDKKLNETDWTVLNILLQDPVISNKAIAEQAYLTVDGIGSSLKRMYVHFQIKESKYKKISLLLEAIKLSNSTT